MSLEYPLSDPACVNVGLGLLRLLRSKEPRLQGLVEEAARRVDAPSSFISILGQGWLTAIARHGSDEPGADVRTSFFRHIGREGLCVADASKDWRFRYHPLVLGHPFFRSFIGSQIVVDGCFVGAFSAVASVTNAFDEDDLAACRGYATAAELIIEELRAEQFGPGKQSTRRSASPDPK